MPHYLGSRLRHSRTDIFAGLCAASAVMYPTIVVLVFMQRYLFWQHLPALGGAVADRWTRLCVVRRRWAHATNRALGIGDLAPQQKI